jgi:hypothetical protein
MSHSRLEIISILPMDDYTLAGVQLLAGAEPDLEMFYVKENTGEQWRVGGFGHLPVKAYSKGVRAITFQSVLHGGNLAKGDFLVEVEKEKIKETFKAYRYHFSFPGLSPSGTLKFFADLDTAHTWVTSKLGALIEIAGKDLFIDTIRIQSFGGKSHIEKNAGVNNNAIAAAFTSYIKSHKDIDIVSIEISPDSISSRSIEIVFHFGLNAIEKQSIKRLPEYEVLVFEENTNNEKLLSVLAQKMQAKQIS